MLHWQSSLFIQKVAAKTANTGMLQYPMCLMLLLFHMLAYRSSKRCIAILFIRRHQQRRLSQQNSINCCHWRSFSADSLRRHIYKLKHDAKTFTHNSRSLKNWSGDEYICLRNELEVVIENKEGNTGNRSAFRWQRVEMLTIYVIITLISWVHTSFDRTGADLGA